MITPTILALGTFAPSDLRVSIAPSNRHIDPESESRLESAWHSMLKQAKDEGRLIYNGTSYRLNSLVQDHGHLAIEFGVFDYKVRDGLLRVPGYFDLSEDYWRKGCFTSATVKTSDDQYILVELSGKSMNLNHLETLGGIIDAEPEIDSGQGIFNSLHKELNEEALIVPEDIASCSLRAVYLERQTNVGFYFEVDLCHAPNIINT